MTKLPSIKNSLKRKARLRKKRKQETINLPPIQKDLNPVLPVLEQKSTEHANVLASEWSKHISSTYEGEIEERARDKFD